MHCSHSVQQHTRYAGLDVDADGCYAVTDGSAKARRFDATPDGAAALAAWLRNQAGGAETVAVMEHTGPYSHSWQALLEAQQVQSALVDAKRVRSFAVACGVRTKTDSADAAAILAYARQFQPRPRARRSLAEWRLSGLLRQRGLLVGQRASLKVQVRTLEQLPGIAPGDLDSAQAIVQTLDQAIAVIETRITGLLRQDPGLRRATQILDSLPGIGPVTNRHICSRLSVLTDCNANQATALCGLSARHNQSGNRQGKSRIDKQGWDDLRCCLYMGAQAAARHSPVFKALFDRLRANGKPYRVAIIAVARKLLITAHSLLRKGELFDPNYQTA